MATHLVLRLSCDLVALEFMNIAKLPCSGHARVHGCEVQVVAHLILRPSCHHVAHVFRGIASCLVEAMLWWMIVQL